MKSIQIKSLLESLDSPSDIKSFEIIERFEDDHLQCAIVEINGISLEFMYFDELGFLEYWKDSKSAFENLTSAIETVKEIAEDNEAE